MKIYFPQWQGSGTGKNIEDGAHTVLEYLDDPDFIKVPLSEKLLEKKNSINAYEAIIDQLSRLKKEISENQPDNLKIVGGDCGLEIVPVSYLNKRYEGDLGVIWFDAHADINAPHESHSCNFHGMPLRTMLGETDEGMHDLLFSRIKPSQIHYVGLRDIDDSEQKRIDTDNIYYSKNADTGVLVETLRSKKLKNLYLHFDFDVLEPTDYDKTYYQVKEGVKIKDALTCIQALTANFNVVGASVLESVTTKRDELSPIKPIVDILMKA
ncbi:hypothetical protein GWK08_11740 [Leptobacterium flavescens]|uniref:Arginase family protein n=1 Tax=Leptobacterium flavescens TaxID=472055 RepID=A0A6P0UUM5_9FLAO|nr:arginase family protein [Leptobacterium flavescens]NER14116.1 hypothetical protein [Leptobacterium flavescens]